MFKNKNHTKIDPTKGVTTTDPKKDGDKVIEPQKDETKVDPKKDETIKI